MTDRLELLPAVDVVDGRAVQLVQGVAGTGGEFGDPLQRMVRSNDGLLTRVVAWLVIAALVVGGGAVLFSALAR